MMAVVDAAYQFRYVSVGAQGRASDAGIFAQSDLKREHLTWTSSTFPPQNTGRFSHWGPLYVFGGRRIPSPLWPNEAISFPPHGPWSEGIQLDSPKPAEWWKMVLNISHHNNAQPRQGNKDQNKRDSATLSQGLEDCLMMTGLPDLHHMFKRPKHY